MESVPTFAWKSCPPSRGIRARDHVEYAPFWEFQNKEEAEQLFNTPPNSIVALLESQGTKAFSIWSTVQTDPAELQPDVRSWSPPSLALIHGTVLGEASFRSYYPHGMIRMHDGVREEVCVDPIRSPVMQEQFDAILYLGSPKDMTWSQISPELSRDPDYMKMRSERLALTGMAPRPSISPALEGALHRSMKCASKLGHKQATSEHLLLSLADDQDAAAVMRACAVDVEVLKAGLNSRLNEAPSFLAAKAEDAEPAADYARAVEQAMDHGQNVGRRQLTGADVLIALLQDESVACGLLRDQGMTRLDAVSFVSHGVTKISDAAKEPSQHDWQSGEEESCRVLLLNDDYTPMDFVIHVLERIFGKTLDQAHEIILRVDQHGSAVCGVFGRREAKAKADEVIAEARRYGHPLLCAVEPDQDR